MKFTALIIAAGLIAAPAFADKMTIEFTPEDGEATTAVFDQAAGTVTMGDKTTTFTWDEESITLCAAMEDGPLCATFAEKRSEVGESSSYTTNKGTSGNATITALEKAE